ncbi:MFS transporter [Streptomyces sp. NPDC087844]|uniref:MFS transporter n=1 Tax=Streptomyces sp. NPDC087844 TaxID=3365805 RepID=UPI00380FCDC3
MRPAATHESGDASAGPVAVVLMVPAVRFLPETARRRGRFDVFRRVGCASGDSGLDRAGPGHRERGRPRLDGTATLLPLAADHRWTAPATQLPLAAHAVMPVLFVRVERRAVQPIVPLRLFASRERSGAYVTRMLYMSAMTWFLFTAQFVQSVYRWTPLRAGLSFLPMTLADFVFAVRVPRLLERFGRPPLLATEVMLTTVGMARLSRLDLHAPYLTGVALPMVVIGAGLGRAPTPMTSSGVDGVAPEDAGAGSGLVNTVRLIGSAPALSILTAVAVAATVPTGHGATAIAARSSTALTGSAVLLALAIVTVFILILPSRASRKERTL